MAGKSFYAKVWGARGSISTSGPDVVTYGGNTPCVSVHCGERVIILDAGTGIRKLGEQLKEGPTTDLDLFFTHSHYDHVEGLPFFAPLFHQEFNVTLWSGHLSGKTTTEEMIRGFMVEPYFPICPKFFKADIGYKDLVPGEEIDLNGEIKIKTCKLNHPGGAVGYRIEYDGRAFCYMTDTEHTPGKPDQNILSAIEGAEVVIYDGSYCDGDFEKFRGFGHSTWQEGARLCDTANVRDYVVFHHRPMWSDDQLAKIENDLQDLRPGSVLARDGMVLNV